MSTTKSGKAYGKAQPHRKRRMQSPDASPAVPGPSTSLSSTRSLERRVESKRKRQKSTTEEPSSRDEKMSTTRSGKAYGKAQPHRKRRMQSHDESPAVPGPSTSSSSTCSLGADSLNSTKIGTLISQTEKIESKRKRRKSTTEETLRQGAGHDAVSRSEWATTEEIGGVKQMLQSLEKGEATRSTLDYYARKKEKSYPVEHDTRGRAIVFTMTNNRQGWIEDVKVLQQIFSALNFKVTHEFDLDTQKIRKKLFQFAKSTNNKDVDCVFIVFMGHGYGGNLNMYLEAKDKCFDVWANCTNVFANEECNLDSKPKVFLNQMCREHTEVPSTESPRDIKDYIFVASSQPGQLAERKASGSKFIQKISAFMKVNAHNTHMSKLLDMVNQHFDESIAQQVSQADAQPVTAAGDQGIDRYTKIKQIPQVIKTTKFKVNLFPGITSQMVSELEGGERKEEHRSEMKLSLEESCIPSTSRVGLEESEVPSTSSTEQILSDERSQNRRRKTKKTQGANVSLKVTSTVNPPQKQKIVDKKIREKLQNKNEARKFSLNISHEMGTKVAVKGASQGCVCIQLEIKEGSEIENVRHLCETGVLAIIFETYIVTEELCAQCGVQSVSLAVNMDMESYRLAKKYLYAQKERIHPIYRHMRETTFYVGKPCKLECDTHGESFWTLNGQRLQEDSAIRIEQNPTKSVLHIKSATKDHAGCYECYSPGTESEYATQTKFSVYVVEEPMISIAPQKVKTSRTIQMKVIQRVKPIVQPVSAVEKIEDPVLVAQPAKKHAYKRYPSHYLDEDRKQIVKKNKTKLTEDLAADAEALLDDLMENQVISDKDFKIIKKHQSKREMIGHLLDVILKKPNKYYETFCKVLCDNNQAELVRDILIAEDDYCTLKIHMAKFYKQYFGTIQLYATESGIDTRPLKTLYTNLTLHRHEFGQEEPQIVVSYMDLLQQVGGRRTYGWTEIRSRDP